MVRLFWSPLSASPVFSLSREVTWHSSRVQSLNELAENKMLVSERETMLSNMSVFRKTKFRPILYELEKNHFAASLKNFTFKPHPQEKPKCLIKE